MSEIIGAFIFGWFAAPALNAVVAAFLAMADCAHKSYKAAKRQEGE